MERPISHLGEDDARDYARGCFVAWKDSLLREGTANITVRDVYVAAVKATLRRESRAIGYTCMLLCDLFVPPFAQHTAGASRHPAFPAPSRLKRTER